MELEDKIALVTGAGRGMGRAISLQLAEAGANIAVSDIDASTAEDTAVAVKQLGRESIVLPADMGDLQDIDRMFRQAKDAFGRIDVRINCHIVPPVYVLASAASCRECNLGSDGCQRKPFVDSPGLSLIHI